MSWLRIVALVEVSTLLLLLAASFAKRALDFPEGVSVLGPIHGVALLAYVGLLLYEREDRGLTWLQTAFALVASVIPFGGFVVERRYFRPDATATIPTPTPTSKSSALVRSV